MIRAILPLLVLVACQGSPTPTTAPVGGQHQSVAILAPLVDTAKLDSLKGKRAATPRLRKICYWLETASRDGEDPEHVLMLAQGGDSERHKAQREALLRNLDILRRLGCLDGAGMEKLRRGNAPTITKGPYAGELATGDHIIPRSVCPELDNRLYNLEFLPETLNQQKGAKIGDRQIQLARKWNRIGLLSDDGLASVLAHH